MVFNAFFFFDKHYSHFTRSTLFLYFGKLKLEKTILPVNGGSELKSDFYKNILEFFKASICFYVKFCN